MRHAKKSTNRDFRITFKEVPEAEEQGQEEEEEAEKSCDEESQVCELSVVLALCCGKHNPKCFKLCTPWLILLQTYV